METYPNFFIVGAAKAGTTSLYEYLNKISKIYMSSVKEPHYFAQDIIDFKVKPNRFRITDTQQYLDLFKGVKDEVAIGEGSTTYLRNPVTAKRIHEKLPDSKIIILLREPIDQVISGFHMNQTQGWVEGSLSEFLEKNLGMNNTRKFRPDFFYSEQVKRYMDFFGSAQVKVIIFEQFVVDPETTVKEVVKFLGINNFPDNLQYEIHNKAEGDKPELKAEEKDFLINYFKEDVKKLELLLGKKIPWPYYFDKNNKWLALMHSQKVRILKLWTRSLLKSLSIK